VNSGIRIDELPDGVEMDLELKGKVALVAAATSGIGLAIAQSLAEEGATVAVCGRSTQRMESALTHLRCTAAGEVTGTTLDITEHDAVRQWVRDTAERYGDLHIVVANSGGPPAGHPSGYSIQDYRAAMELVLLSAVALVNEAVPYLRRAGYGRVLFVSSRSVKAPLPGLALSNTARPGLLGFAKSLVHELGNSGITVNVLAPGLTLTPSLQDWAQDVEGGTAALTAKIPLGRAADPSEIGSVAAFLAGSRASFVNGTVIPIDGGACQNLY
jgi:3-oxoacyl-[acyl-carrier protein] reductase